MASLMKQRFDCFDFGLRIFVSFLPLVIYLFGEYSKSGKDRLLQNDPSHEKLPESESVCAMQILGYTGTA